MRRQRVGLILVLALAAAAVGRGDEGMWTFDNVPRKLIKEKYGFDITDQWLEHVRLASVRVGEGGSGSFVSPDGLLFTNQHIGRGQVTKLSTPQRDLVKEGFYAATRQDELKCADLEVNVLVSYDDVTARVQGSVNAGASDKDANSQRKAEMSAIEKECSTATGLKCEVITLYSGGEYWLYRNRKYTDLRLVFAPEEQIAYFGGDYDNFTYPRWNFDITFFRVYENGQPLKTPHYLKWSKAGAAEGELIFTPGYPGSTARLLTVAQIKYQRDLGNPTQMEVWTSRRDALARYAGLGAEQTRRASAGRLGLENSIKRLVGQQDGLLNPRVFRKKEDDEAALRARVAAKPEWQQAYAPAWDQVATAYAGLPAYAKRLAFSNLTASRLAGMASTIVRYAGEIQKPSAQRYPEFTDARLEGLKFGLFSPAPVYADMEEAQLAAWLEDAQKMLGPDDAFVKAALGGQAPQALAKQIMSGTTLADVAARKALVERGPTAIAASADPLIALARRVEPVIRELRAWQEEKIQPEDRRGTLRRIRQDRVPRCELQLAARIRHRARLRGGHDPRACEDDVLWTVRAGGRVQREGAVHPARAVAGRAREARPGDALQLRLHRRHDWRQLGQPRDQPQRRDLRDQLRQQRAEAAESVHVHRRSRGLARGGRALGRYHRGPEEALRRRCPRGGTDRSRPLKMGTLSIFGGRACADLNWQHGKCPHFRGGRP
jgi:hypothetical protein